MEQTLLFINDAVSPKTGERCEIKPYSIGNSDTIRSLPVAIIAVVGKNGEIGINGDLIWHIPEDLKHFKSLTLGGAVIMGRKTWESLPRKPLPGRLNIVVTRSSDYVASGAVTVNSLEEAIQKAKGNKTFIIGGGEIYSQALPMADKLYITAVDASEEKADTFFPHIDTELWALDSQSERMSTPDGLQYQFLNYSRKF